MAVTLDATVGGTTSNSYVTLARGNQLIEQLPHGNDWILDPSISKSVLLIHATRLVDRSVWFVGEKTSTSQALEWPRRNVSDERSNNLISSAIIPDFVEWATVEWALYLNAEGDELNLYGLGLTSLRTPSYTADFGGPTSRRMPSVVSELLLPYGQLVSRSQIRLIRA